MSFFGSDAPDGQSGIVSNLLAKIQQGTSAVPVRNEEVGHGALDYVVHRRFISEDVVEAFGIELLEDNEVKAVKQDGLCARAGLPSGVIILYVNGLLVETNAELYAECTKSVDVTLTCFSSSGMEELIARFMAESDEGKSLNFDSLLRTSPRFEFLSMKHPLHLHWEARLRKARATQNALRKLEEEQRRAEEERQKEALRLLEALEEAPETLPEKVEQPAISKPVASEIVAKAVSPTLTPIPRVASVFKDAEEPDQVEAKVAPVRARLALPDNGVAASSPEPHASEERIVPIRRQSPKPPPPPRRVAPERKPPEEKPKRAPPPALPPPRPRPPAAVMCQDFLRGRCHRKVCIFSHQTPVIPRKAHKRSRSHDRHEDDSRKHHGHHRDHSRSRSRSRSSHRKHSRSRSRKREDEGKKHRHHHSKEPEKDRHKHAEWSGSGGRRYGT